MRVYGVLMSKPKVTIGCRIPDDWIGQIDAVVNELGVSRSEWFAGLVSEALRKQDAGTVRSLQQRLTTVEQRLNKLARLVMQ
ncbi:hypothetical protein C7B82_09320 [Stenomitos frigidus ULC18]|uniref:Uncharacterized protein n=2 Tax=Stenomitos TaxID=1844270 RepID=A0A2T1EBK4_9CYAN|nr:hypothetical protein C7B82_09320 [Stenomitos frigidus ULC18]